MSKKAILIIGISIIVLTALIVGVIFILRREPKELKGREVVINGGGMIAENQLMALTETEDEAKKIAESYGIEFISFSYGVAVYHTEEPLEDVIKRGKDNNYPELSINYIRTVQ